jgi:hypothetical protein
VARVFVSYRRADAAGWARRLVDRLAERFGAESVFQDVDAIAPGEDFAKKIADFLSVGMAEDAELRLREAREFLAPLGNVWWLRLVDGFLCDAVRAQDRPREFLRLADAFAATVVSPIAAPPSSANCCLQGHS